MRIILIVAFLLTQFNTTAQENQWSFEPFAEVVNGSSVLFSIEIGKKSDGYDGNVIWKITNNTNQTVYEPRLARFIYYLQDGDTNNNRPIFWKAQSIIPPGESVFTDVIHVNTNNYGGFDDKENPIVKVEFDSPILTVKVGENKKEISVKDMGSLRLVKD